ncbi:CBS domain-containing protein [Ornithinibacillus salinisoli]|uniref:CBS domain-containing protein n=1 Tax=Ornithinibacillus salinisoli TaxID=1848459 RepID=A0ABW4VYY1_9BACI
MSQNVISVTPQQSLKEAAELMVQNDIGAIPVVENGMLRGIITDRDITTRGTAMGKDGNGTVGECMSDQLTTADASMDIHQAAQMMAEKQIRRLPVTENGKLAGMISLGDLATQNIFQNEASQALTNISVPTHNNQTQQGQQMGQQAQMNQQYQQQAAQQQQASQQVQNPQNYQ